MGAAFSCCLEEPTPPAPLSPVPPPSRRTSTDGGARRTPARLVDEILDAERVDAATLTWDGGPGGGHVGDAVFLDVGVGGSEPRRVVIALRHDVAPVAAHNFRALCVGVPLGGAEGGRATALQVGRRSMDPSANGSGGGVEPRGSGGFGGRTSGAVGGAGYTGSLIHRVISGMGGDAEGNGMLVEAPAHGCCQGPPPRTGRAAFAKRGIARRILPSKEGSRGSSTAWAGQSMCVADADTGSSTDTRCTAVDDGWLEYCGWLPMLPLARWSRGAQASCTCPSMLETLSNQPGVPQQEQGSHGWRGRQLKSRCALSQLDFLLLTPDLPLLTPQG